MYIWQKDLHRLLILLCHAGPGMLLYCVQLANVKWMEMDWALKKEGRAYPCYCRGRRTERAVRSKNRDYLAEQK